MDLQQSSPIALTKELVLTILMHHAALAPPAEQGQWLPKMPSSNPHMAMLLIPEQSLQAC